MARASILSSSIRYSTTPGSRLPQRVPIGRPSAAVNPIVLATLRPPAIAHMLEPLPRCSTTTLPAAARASCSRQARRRCIRTTGRGSRSGCTPRSVIDLGSANACATGGCPRWNAVSKQATCGSCGRRSSSARIGARLCGWCSGASGMYFSSAVDHRRVDAHRLACTRVRRARRDDRRRPAGARRAADAGIATR